MDFDLDPVLIKEVGQVVRRRGVAKAVALTSELAAAVFSLGIKRFLKDDVAVKVLPVKNRFFGGSIGAAGLLTIEDFRISLAEYLIDNPGNKPGIVLLPGLAFDRQGRDLTGRSYLELEKYFKIYFEVL